MTGWPLIGVALAGLVVLAALGLGLALALALTAGATLGLRYLYDPRSPATIARRLRSRRGWSSVMAEVREVWSDPVAGSLAMPRLIDAQPAGRVVVLTIRPMMPPARWIAFGDALRRALLISAPAGEPPIEIAPGIVRYTLGLDPLPDPRSGQTRADAVPDVPGEVVLGHREGGGRMSWIPAEAPHLLVTGLTRGGKGVAIRAILAQLTRQGWRLIVVDPKASPEYVALEELGEDRVRLVHPARQDGSRSLGAIVEPMVGALEAAVVAMDDRQRHLLAARRQRVFGANLDKVADLPPAMRPVPVVVVVDEAPALFEVRGDRDARAVFERASAAAAAIAARGAAVDVHLLLIAQRADASLLGGGWVRSNVAGRLVVGRTDAEGLRMLFPGAPAGELLARLLGLPGRGLAQGLSAGDGMAVVGFQTTYLDQDTILGEVA